MPGTLSFGFVSEVSLTKNTTSKAEATIESESPQGDAKLNLSPLGT